MRAIRVIIHGRVQGVSYRAWTVKNASAAGIRGWVRNRSEGTVEAVFLGESDAVDGMLEACKRGPMLARVDKIEQFAITPTGEEKDFRALPTV